MQLFVVGLRETQVVNVDPSAHVSILKETLQASCGIRLLFAGLELQDDKPLIETGLREGSTLHAACKLAGGGCGSSKLFSSRAETRKGRGRHRSSRLRSLSIFDERDLDEGARLAANRLSFLEMAETIAADSSDINFEAIPGYQIPRTQREGWKEMLRPVAEEVGLSELSADDQSVLRGSLGGDRTGAAAALTNSFGVKVFISALDDSEWERNFVARDLVPFWQELARVNQVCLEVSENRWGIDVDFSNVHSYEEITSKELDSLQRQSLHFCHILIVGQKYGMRSFPTRIQKQRFEDLLRNIENAQEKKLVKDFFCLDTNQDDDGNLDEIDRGQFYLLDLNKIDEDWRKKFEKIRVALSNAAQILKQSSVDSSHGGTKSKHDDLKMLMLGMLEREFLQGNIRQEVYMSNFKRVVFHRNIFGLDSAKISHPAFKTYVDLNDSGAIDAESQQMLTEFLESMPAVLTRNEYLVHEWNEVLGLNPIESLEHANYLGKCCDDMCTIVSNVILDAARSRRLYCNPVVEETKTHLNFVMETAPKFCSYPETDQVMDNILKYLDQNIPNQDNHIFYISGPHGSGKTTLMCKLAKEIVSANHSGCVIVRIIGASNRSKTQMDLLKSICQQVRLVYGRQDQDFSAITFRDVVAYFRKAINDWPSMSCPLTIFIDGVDELDQRYSGSHRNWIPIGALPNHVRIVLSFGKPEAHHGYLDRKSLPLLSGHPNKLMVECVKDPKFFLSAFLRKRGRRLTNEQWTEVLDAWRRREDDPVCANFWLALVGSAVQDWPSFAGVMSNINPTVVGLLVDVFEAMQVKHGKELVRTSLSYIVLAGPQKLEETELLHLLSLDDDALAEAYFWAVPHVRVIPPFLVKSLLHDARRLLYRFSDADHMNCLSLRNEKLAEVVETWLWGHSLGYKDKIRRHGQLSDYYDGTWSRRKKPYTGQLLQILRDTYNELKGDRLVPPQPIVLHGTITSPPRDRVLNYRRIQVLVHHLIACRDEKRAVAELCSLEYMTAKMLSDGIAELLRETSHAIKVFPDSVVALHEVKGFIGRNLELWRAPPCPNVSFQLALQEPDRSAVLRCFRESQTFSGSFGGMRFVEWLNKPRVSHPCVLTIQEHEDAVMAVALSPSGKHIASSSKDGTVVVSSTATGEVRAVLRGHSDQVSSVCFSPNSDLLASVGWDRQMCLWSVSSWSEQGTPRPFTSNLSTVAFSSSSSYIAVAGGELGGSEETVCVCYAKTGELKASLEGHEAGVTCLQFHPRDDQVVASSSYDETVRVWNLSSRRQLLVYSKHADWVRAVSFNPASSSELASAGEDRTVRVWDTQTGEDRLVLRGHAREIHSVAWTRSGDFLASGSEDKTIRVWATKDGEVHSILRGHDKGVNSLCFSHNGRILVSGSSDHAVKVWVVDKDRPEGEEEEAHAGKIFNVAFNHKEPKIVASCSSDKTIQLWNFETGAATSAGLGGHTDYVLDVAFSPHAANILASCSSDTSVRLWDIHKFHLIHPPMLGHNGAVCSILFHPSDPAVLVSAGADATIRVWSVSNGRMRRTLRGHEASVTALACSRSDANLLVSGGQDGKIKLWHLLEGSTAGADLLGHESSVTHLRFTEQGKLVSCCAGGWLSLWDIASSSCLLRWDSRMRLALTSDRFVLAFEQGNLFLFDLPSGPGASWSPRAFFKAPNAIAAIACSGDDLCMADESHNLLRMRVGAWQS